MPKRAQIALQNATKQQETDPVDGLKALSLKGKDDTAKSQEGPAKQDVKWPALTPLQAVSLTAVATYANAIQDILATIAKSKTFGVPGWIHLPLICPAARISSRFACEEDAVSMMQRSSYSVLKSYILDSARSGKTIYLNGPIGVGKSHLLYALVCDLQSEPTRFRVTYIHDCQKWRHDPISYLLNALVMGFHDFPDVLETAMTILDTADCQTQQSQLRRLERKILTFILDKQVSWIWVCDQHNALHAGSAVDRDFPFDILHRMEDLCTVVLSASANNEGFSKRPERWIVRDVGVRTFDALELELWCLKFGYEEESDRKLAVFWTGGLPYELDLLHNTQGSSLSDKLAHYVVARENEISRTHLEYYRSLSKEDKKLLRANVAAMELETPVRIFSVLDNKYMEMRADKIVALTPLYRRAITSVHSVTRRQEANQAAAAVLSGDVLENDAKGRVIERLLIMSFEDLRRYTFVAKRLKVKGRKLHEGEVKYEGDIERVVYFDGEGLPEEPCPPDEVVLFVPTVTKYPGGDFFICDKQKQRLIVGQITVTHSLIDHVPTTENKALKLPAKAWAEYIGIDQNSIIFLWMCPNQCLKNIFEHTIQDDMSHYVVVFSTLQELCPAVMMLKLKQPKKKVKTAGAS